ncbi:MAG: ATP-binding protein [Actinomycetota bacterium]|nr:ATP-binding protein [Actinomycetota bacterium]
MVRNLGEAERAGRLAKKLQTYLKPAVLVLERLGTCRWAEPRPTWCSSSSRHHVADQRRRTRFRKSR